MAIPDYPPLPPSTSPPSCWTRFGTGSGGWDAKRTETSYVHWIKRYTLFHGKRHPREMGKAEVEAFLSNLAVERHVGAATQPA